jgi:hypothetical protein
MKQYKLSIFYHPASNFRLEPKREWLYKCWKYYFLDESDEVCYVDKHGERYKEGREEYIDL